MHALSSYMADTLEAQAQRVRARYTGVHCDERAFGGRARRMHARLAGPGSSRNIAHPLHRGASSIRTQSADVGAVHHSSSN